MAEEITRYEGKVEKFILTKDLLSITKNKPKCVIVTSTNIVVSGKKEPFRPIKPIGIHNDWQIDTDWDLTIPLHSIRDVFYQSFKAEGVMNHHNEAVGIEATIDGALMNYAIFDKKHDQLFKVIQGLINDKGM